MGKACSIIIRTRNEGKWIGSCLSAVFSQTYRDFEVILVDNESTDRTVPKAEQFPVAKILHCQDYLPGKALNIGIREARGDYIVCLSGHCIPATDEWLSALIRNLDEDDRIAGVYGRQEPMAFSSDADKRDLLLIFGFDRKIQSKDSFFHNANSIIRRTLWEESPFDETVTNIEDRLWAQEMLKRGYKLAYEPEARVYHHHGIHQNGDTERCANVVRILETMGENRNTGSIKASDLNVICLVPVKGPGLTIAGRPALAYTVTNALESRFVRDVYVSTDDGDLADVARTLGARAPFIRPASLSKDYVGLETVFRYFLEQIEGSGVYPDLVVTLEPTFPFRPRKLIDQVIQHVLDQGLDTVIAARKESSSLWKESGEGVFERMDSGYVPRKYKEQLLVGLKGLCCVTHPAVIRQERILGDRVGLFPVQNSLSSVEVREERDVPLAEQLIPVWESLESHQNGFK